MESNTLGFKIFSFFAGLSGIQAYGLIFGVLFFCGMGLPVPEDITLISAGYLAGKGKISFAGAMIVGFVGVLIGDTILFTIGRKYGRRVFAWPGARRIFTPERVRKAEDKIQQNAKLICFTARFAPGLRAPVYLTAGVLKVPFRTFFFQDGLAALVSVPVWIWAGWYFHEEMEKAFDLVAESHIYLIGLVLLVVAYLVIKSHIAKKKNAKPFFGTRRLKSAIATSISRWV